MIATQYKQSEYQSILRYLMTVSGISKKICAGCSYSKLYDKNGKEYLISRKTTMTEAKQMVEEILKTNSINV